MYQILTYVNIAGCIFAVYYTINYTFRYDVPPRWKMFIFFNLLGIVFMFLSQIYTLFIAKTWWLLKIGSFYFWSNMIYLIWLLRFISIRKK